MVVRIGPIFINPVGQGSMTNFGTVNGRERITHRNRPALLTFRQVVATQAQAVAGETFFTGPVEIRARFLLGKPASAPKRTRTFPIGQRSGDLDHYIRSIGDALTGVIFPDDSIVVSVTAVKDYAEPGSPPSVEIEVSEVGPEADLDPFRRARARAG